MQTILKTGKSNIKEFVIHDLYRYKKSVSNINVYSGQGGRNWYYQNTDGSTYSDLTWNSLTTRWETSGTVNPYVGTYVQTSGTHYQDANNYYYMMMNHKLGNTQLFKVKNGTRILLAGSDGVTDWVDDNDYHKLSIERNKNTGSIIVGMMAVT